MCGDIDWEPERPKQKGNNVKKIRAMLVQIKKYQTKRI